VRALPAENYFTAIPHSPTGKKLEVIRADLRRICGRPKAWLTPPWSMATGAENRGSSTWQTR